MMDRHMACRGYTPNLPRCSHEPTCTAVVSVLLFNINTNLQRDKFSEQCSHFNTEFCAFEGFDDVAGLIICDLSKCTVCNVM